MFLFLNKYQKLAYSNFLVVIPRLSIQEQENVQWQNQYALPPVLFSAYEQVFWLLNYR